MTGNDIIEFLSENASSLVTAVGPVAGAFFTAIFLRNNTATTEFEKVQAGMFKEVAEELLKSGKMTYTEFYKANNFLKIAEKADEEFAKSPHNKRTEPYNFDWFVRFYEATGNISDEELQNWWARILAGEINKPHTYSLRTIEILKNMSQEEAELFQEICSHCISHGQALFIPHYDKYLEKCGISFSVVLYLSELGLISSDSMLLLKIPVDSTPKIAFINNDLLITLSSSGKSTLMNDIRQFPLSAVGHELATLVGWNASDEEFITFAKEIRSNTSLDVGVHKIISIDGDDVQYHSDKILEQDELSSNT